MNQRTFTLYAIALGAALGVVVAAAALLGGVALDWSDASVGIIGAAGLGLTTIALAAAHKLGFLAAADAVRESDRAHDAWIDARRAGATDEELEALYDAWQAAYAREARARHGK